MCNNGNSHQQQRRFYSIGLQTNPDFEHDDDEGRYADEFPYNALPAVRAEATRRREAREGEVR